MKKEPILFKDPDPFDGGKAVGCLLVGVVLLLAVIYLFGYFINSIR